MINPTQLEEAFKGFAQNFHTSVPDGVLEVNLALLQELGLLNHAHLEQAPADNLMHYFHVVETADKVTLFNEQFAIWIVPKVLDESPSTHTFIALIHNNAPHLEIVFSTEGVYNTPRYILKILQHFLTEVIDTETIISNIDKKKPPSSEV
jgi:hypothetical protein